MEPHELRRRAEERYANREVPRGASGASPEEVLEELRVHQIELEIQNEELRSAQIELQRSQRRYFELYELAPVGYLTVQSDGSIVSANLRATSMTGRDRAWLTRSSFFSLVDPGLFRATRNLLDAAVHAPGEPQTADLILAGEPPLPVHAEVMCREDGEIMVCLADISREHAARQEAQQLAEQNRTLLRELRHRVKNDLHLLQSVIMLQRRTADVAASAALATVEERIHALSAVHGTLDRGGADSADLVEALTSVVRQFALAGDVDVRVDADVAALPVVGPTAVALALAVNELVANAAKYARTDEGNAVVRVGIHRRSRPSLLTITVRDNGPGLPDHLTSARLLTDGDPEAMRDADPASGGLGMVLVEQLVVHQLDGSWTRANAADGGALHTIEVTLQPPAAIVV